MLVYFDTSAVNYVADKLSIGDAIATRGFQTLRGRRWLLSPVGIWEILNTSNEGRREELIYFSQHLFFEQLLPSPEELLIAYISQGCPLIETPRQLVSESPLAATWLDLCRDDRKTFILDHQEIRQRFRMVVPITRDLHRLTRDRDISIERYAPHVGWDISLERVVDNLSWVKNGEVLTHAERRLYKISVFFILFLLCAEIGVDPGPVQKYWRKIGIDRTYDRFRYIMANHEALVHRGPLLVMAYMTVVQSAHKFSRGVYWDCLHSFYLTYVDRMFSEDQHFMDLREALPHSPNKLKIHKPSEMEWESHDRENPDVNPWLA